SSIAVRLLPIRLRKLESNEGDVCKSTRLNQLSELRHNNFGSGEIFIRPGNVIKNAGGRIERPFAWFGYKEGGTFDPSHPPGRRIYIVHHIGSAWIKHS